MSSVVVTDENQGALPICKQVPSESGADIFALDQPTGRPSILRPSQVENINKNIPKGVKVCFQTPLRDPVTKRIVSPSHMGQMATLDDCTNALESLTLTAPASPSTSTLLIDAHTKMDSSFADENIPIQSRGNYTIDFDNLDSVNPFQSSCKMTLSPSNPAALMSDTLTLTDPAPAPEEVETVTEKADMGLDETLPFVPSVENSLADLSADGTSTDSTVIIEPRKTALTDHSADYTVNLEASEPAPAVEDVKDSVLLPKGSYEVDFENIDSMNPFKTGGSKIPNSPPAFRKSPVRDPAPPKAEEARSGVKDVEMPSEREDKPSTVEKPSLTEVSPVSTASSTSPQTKDKEAPLVLEFNFDDGTEVKRKPPPKRLGLKRPPLSKTKSDSTKPESAPVQKKSPEIKSKSGDMLVSGVTMEIPPARGSYTIDLNQLNDPDFNPFGTSAKMASSPPRDAPISTSPAQPEVQDSTVEGRMHSCPSSKAEKAAEAEPSFLKSEEPEPLHLSEALQPCLLGDPQPQKMEEPALSCTLTQSSSFDAAADDEFVPGSMFIPSDLDGQIDYLEQFGCSNFKESALRKQSLYLKFDPLLKESPKKAAVDSSSSGFSLPRASLAIRMMEAAKSEVRQKSQQDSTKLLEDFPPPVRHIYVQEAPPVDQDPVLDLLAPAPALTQAQGSEEVIVDVLKYTQNDMDAALEKARKQAEDNEADLKAQIEKLTLDNQHMLLIIPEFEAILAKNTAEHKQKEELAQAELSRVLQEKQLLAKELSDMERSFSDVVKRLDRRKEVIEGFKKNEETLKQCAQSYLAKLQKEEQRYQMLKAHAEEKIDQANKHIAEVRSKLGTEVSTLQVQLRREQLKVQSLEKNLEQKTKELEDVTKLCDELIVKVQQH